MTPPSAPRSHTLDPAARERDDLAEAFARLLLSDGPIARQAPVFFLEPDGTMIWANDGYYALAALLVNSPEAQRLLHPSAADTPNAVSTWSASARGIANGRPVTVRASYANVAYGTRQKPALVGLVQVVPDEADVARRLMATQERLEDIIRLVSDWIWEAAPDGTFTVVSDRVQRATLYHPRELVGTKIMRLASDGSVADACWRGSRRWRRSAISLCRSAPRTAARGYSSSPPCRCSIPMAAGISAIAAPPATSPISASASAPSSQPRRRPSRPAAPRPSSSPA